MMGRASAQPNDDVMRAAVDVDAVLQSVERLRSHPPVTYSVATGCDLVETRIGLFKAPGFVSVVPDVAQIRFRRAREVIGPHRNG